MLHYPANLQKRMESRKFSRADRLSKVDVAARYTMPLLVEDVHLIHCGPSYPGNEQRARGTPRHTFRFTVR